MVLIVWSSSDVAASLARAASRWQVDSVVLKLLGELRDASKAGAILAPSGPANWARRLTETTRVAVLTQMRQSVPGWDISGQAGGVKVMLNWAARRPSNRSTSVKGESASVTNEFRFIIFVLLAWVCLLRLGLL